MKGAALALDTSCYTTSVACYGEAGVLYDGRSILPVPRGGRGLRQSEGLFLHTKQLPPLVEAAFSAVKAEDIAIIACSAAPTGEKDSYMPVFLCGSGAARSLSAALHKPLLLSDHQRGHIRAALIGNEGLFLEKDFYALHLSGGTTDLLLVEMNRDKSFQIKPLGCSEDLHGGQLVDRVGAALGCGFPCGKELETLAKAAKEQRVKVPASVQRLNCSFSGAESAFQRLVGKEEPNEIAFGVYDTLSRTLKKLFTNLFKELGEKPVLLCGGVASSLLLREMLKERCPYPLLFGESRFSSDNAVGVAALAFDRLER